MFYIGVGNSLVARCLYDAGYRNLCLLDLEVDSINCQKNLFKTIYFDEDMNVRTQNNGRIDNSNKDNSSSSSNSSSSNSDNSSSSTHNNSIDIIDSGNGNKSNRLTTCTSLTSLTNTNYDGINNASEKTIHNTIINTAITNTTTNNITTTKTVQIIKCNILEDNLTEILQHKSFQIILDKSFLDVFLRQGSYKQVFEKLKSRLLSNGLYIAFSMFHSKWKRVFSKKDFCTTLYGSLEVSKHSRTRPLVKGFSCPVAIIVGQYKGGSEINNDNKNSNNDNNKNFINGINIQSNLNMTSIICGRVNFSLIHKINQYSFPSTDASIF